MVFEAEVRSLLRDVLIEGAVVVSKRKLLWLLGRGQDRAGAWATLMELWQENGEKPNTLMGLEAGPSIVLTLVPVSPAAKHQLISAWAAG